MKSKTLIWLALAAVASAALALWLSSERAAVTGTRDDGRLFPELLAAINDVTALEIRELAEKESVRLERVDGRWTVRERDGYPAQLGELRRVLIALAEAELLEPKTSRPELHGELGVEDPGAPGAASTEVTVTLGDGSSRVLIAGKTGYRGETTTYVRRAGEDQSWNVSGNLAFDGDPVRWLEKEIIDLPTPIVHRVRIEHPDGEVLEIVKDVREAPDFALVDLPEGRELLSPSSPNSIAGALGGLRLEDVVSAASFDPAGAEPVTVVFESFDGRRIVARAWAIGEARFLALEPSFDASLVVSAGAPTESEDGAGDTAAEEPLEAPADAAEAMEALSGRVAGWVYRIPSYKFGNLTKRVEDLLEPAAEAAADS